MTTKTRTRKHRTTFRRGEVRRVNVNGREQLSFPITALLEKTYQYPEWGRAEYLSADRLHESVSLWSDIPIFVDHPDSFAADTTAEDPEAFEEAIIGRGHAPEIIAHEHDDGETSAKLRINEARVDLDVAKEISGAVWETVRRIDNGQVVHVSPGYKTIGDEKEHGSYRGEEYSVRQGVIMPDHIALIPPGSTGRCTPQDGCAAPRMNAIGAAGDTPPAAQAVTEDANVMSSTDTDPDAQPRVHDTVAGVSFTGKADGKLDKSALDPEKHTLSDHYLYGSGENKKDHSYPVVDASNKLRKGNVAAAHQLGARGGVDAADLKAKLQRLNEQWSEDEQPIDFDDKENMLTADDAAAEILGIDLDREPESDGPEEDTARENAMVSEGDRVRWTNDQGNTRYGIVVSVGGGQRLNGNEARVQIHTQANTNGGTWRATDSKQTKKRSELSVLGGGFPPKPKENMAPTPPSDTSAMINAYHRLIDAVTSGSEGRSATDSDLHVHAAGCTFSGPGGTCSCGLHDKTGTPKHEHATIDDLSQGTWVSWGDSGPQSQPLGTVRRTYSDGEEVPEQAYKGSGSQSGPAALIATYEETNDGWQLKDGEFGDNGEERVAHDPSSLMVIESPLESRENAAVDAAPEPGSNDPSDSVTAAIGGDGSAGDGAGDSKDSATTTTNAADTIDMSDTDNDDATDDRLEQIANATEFDLETLQNMSDQQLSVIENGIDDDADADADADSDSDSDADMKDTTDDAQQTDPQQTDTDSTDDPSAADAGPSDIADAEKVHKLESTLSEVQNTLETVQEQNEQLREKVEAPENAKREAAREHLSEQCGVEPESFEGMDDDALAELARQHGMDFSGGGGSQRANGTGVALNGSRENAVPASMQTGGDRSGGSPSADMRGRGGASDSEDEETEREHSADPGRDANGYPKKGRKAWKQRTNN